MDPTSVSCAAYSFSGIWPIGRAPSLGCRRLLRAPDKPCQVWPRNFSICPNLLCDLSQELAPILPNPTIRARKSLPSLKAYISDITPSRLDCSQKQKGKKKKKKIPALRCSRPTDRDSRVKSAGARPGNMQQLIHTEACSECKGVLSTCCAA
ncbi:hypothetical protein BDW60DRAFT_646 [Aspergillus nidulans var. acristatus]